MADFDPKAYLEKKKFNPGAYLRSKGVKASADEVRTVQTPDGPVRMTADGRRVFTPEEYQGQLDAVGARMRQEALETGLSAIHGASNSLTSKLAGAWNAVKNPMHPLDAFNEGQAQAAATVDDAVRKHPVANIAGALAMPAPGVGKAKAGAKLLTRALEAAVPAATVGGLNAFGQTRAADDAPGAALDTLKGTGIAGGVGALFGVSGGALSRANAALRTLAEDKALGAITQPGISNKLQQAGLRTPEQARALARWLLDNKVVRFGDSAESIANKASNLIEEHGEGIGDLIGKADADAVAKSAAAAERNAAKVAEYQDKAGAFEASRRAAVQQWIDRESEIGAAKAARQKAADEMLTEQKLAALRGQPAPASRPLPELPPEAPIPLLPAEPAVPQLERQRFGGDAKRAADAMRDELGGLHSVDADMAGKARRLANAVSREESPSFATLWNMKSQAQKKLSPIAAPGEQEIYRNTVARMTGDVYDQLGEYLTGEDLQRLRNTASAFGKLKQTLKLAGDKATREAAKSKPSLGTEMMAERIRDTIGGRLGAAGAEGVLGAGKFFERRGSSMKAGLADLAAKGVQLTPSALDSAALSHDVPAEAIKVAAWLKALRRDPSQ